MARRALKPLTPLLIALVAVILGFLAIGPSFADTGGVAPAGGLTPGSTTSVPTGPQVPPAPPAAGPAQTALREEKAPAAGKPAAKPKPPKSVEPTPVGCASCMAPPGS